MAVNKTTKLHGLVWFIYIQKTVHLRQLKGMQHSKLVCERGTYTICQQKAYVRDYLFSQ